MTAIITIRKHDRIVFVSDGAVINTADQTLSKLATKVGLVSSPPALIGVRGNASLVHALSGNANANGSSFDELTDSMEHWARSFVPKMPGDSLNEEITFAGYSERHQRLMMYFLPCANNYAASGLGAFKLHEISEDFVASPWLPGDEAHVEGICSDLSAFEPETHGLRLMESMRRRYGHMGIGGFVQVSEVTEDGVSARFIHRWPDVIGEVIKP
jgi:hypothetical protein